MSDEGPPRDANSAPAGGSAAAQPQAWGDDASDEPFETALRRAGFDDVQRRSMPPGTRVPEHAHPFDVRALILNGAITLTVEGIEYAYREGDIFIMPAGIRHAEAAGPAGVDYLVGRRHAMDAPPIEQSRAS